MSNAPLMPMATAVWLVENTTLTFRQIATFCNLHEVEVQGIADGEVAKGIMAYNPIISGQLTRDEIELSSTHRFQNDLEDSIHALYQRIIMILGENNIEIPFPTQTLLVDSTIRS